MNKKSRRVHDRVQDIREALANIQSDIGLLTKEQFLTDGKTQRTIIEGIIVIGEAANAVMHLSSKANRSSGRLSEMLTICGSF